MNTSRTTHEWLEVFIQSIHSKGNLKFVKKI
jgi:hypothetical protein